MAADRFKEPRKKAQILSKPFMRHIFHHEKRLLMFNFDDQTTTHVWNFTKYLVLCDWVTVKAAIYCGETVFFRLNCRELQKLAKNKINSNTEKLLGSQ